MYVSFGSSNTESGEPQQIVMPCVQSSSNTQPSSSQPEVRTASGRLVRKPARFRDFVFFMPLNRQ